MHEHFILCFVQGVGAQRKTKNTNIPSASSILAISFAVAKYLEEELWSYVVARRSAPLKRSFLKSQLYLFLKVTKNSAASTR